MKKEKTITLSGKKWNVGFDFSTLLAFEDIAGHPLESINTLTKKDNIILLYASLLTFNDDMPDFNDWLHTVTNIEVFIKLNKAVSPHVTEFFTIPKIAEQQSKEGDAKNA